MLGIQKKNCETCGKEYQPPREKSSYCSRSCQVVGKNKKSARSPVTLTCKTCGNNFEVPYGMRNSRQTCSRKCGRALAELTIDKVEFGRAISRGKIGKTHRGAPHTDNTKKILSEKMRVRMSGPDNPFLGKKRSFESRDKQSKTRSQRFVDGTYQWKMWTESGYVDTTKAGRIFCRSSWEKRVAEILDADMTVVSFEVEPLSLEYYREEGERLNLRHYVPDFLVTYSDGRRVLIEVKPQCHVDAAINIAKFAAAREYCSMNGLTFEVWTQEKLGEVLRE